MTREEGQREELEDANRMMKMKMSSYKDWVHFFETWIFDSTLESKVIIDLTNVPPRCDQERIGEEMTIGVSSLVFFWSSEEQTKHLPSNPGTMPT